MKYAFQEDGSDTFKADGIMVTHPDADHFDGILKLFQDFPPNQDPAHGNAKFKVKGPLLLTKFFESDRYGRKMNVIKDAKFQKKNIASGEKIDGFEKHFTFFYPEDKYPGTLYTYQPPSFIPNSFAMLASARYSPSTSNPNLSSTILVINDPHSTNPLISLNGDAIGHSIIQSLSGKYPKIFKVSHHGSIHNSIALKEYVPNELKSTQKLLATLALLQVELNNDKKFLNKQITSRSLKTFSKKFTDQSYRQVGAKRVQLIPIYFEVGLAELAKKFNTLIMNRGINSAGLLQKLIKLSDGIDRNLKNPKVNSVDLYTHEIPDKNVLNDFVEKHYDYIKTETLKSAPSSYGSKAYRKIYSMLETDRAFSGKVAFTLSRAFYLKVNAQTYFISSGNLHDHPNWEVINGIIAAAHDHHQKNPNYKCRLLLTSGNNIKADKLGELALTDDWTRYVSLQYFASNTASVEIDSDETNPLAVLPGTVQWQGALSEQKQNELLDSYYQTKGAQELKVARAASSGLYEINPSTAKNSWLTWQLSSKGYELALSSQKAVIAVKNVGIIFAKSIQNIVTKFEFKQPSSDFFQLVYGLLGVHTPVSEVLTYLLYTLSNDNKEMYFIIKDGGLSTTNKKEDGTNFQFTSVQGLNFAVSAPKKQFTSVQGVNFAVSAPKTVSQARNSQLATTDDKIPVTSTYDLKSEAYVRNFQQYLISLGITKNISTFKIFDAVILLLQSETFAFVYLSSLSRKMLGGILEWSINEEASSVEFVEFPTGPVVISADIVAEIPDDHPPLDLGWRNHLKINKIGFTLPNQLESVDSMYLFANATIGGAGLQLKALAPDVDMLPTFEVSLTKPLSLNDVTDLLRVGSGISEFVVPLTSNILKDVQITETTVTYQQGIQGTQQVYLKKVVFGFKFENLAKYLPSSFSSLQSISAFFAIYQPNIPPVQVALEVYFEFHVTVPVGKSILLNALFATEPVLAGSGAVASYNFTVSVHAKSDVIGTTEGGISLNDFLQVFGLSHILQAAHRIPILSSLLASIELKQLVLAMNTKRKEVNEFVLELMIFNWIIIPEKVIVEEASITMSYIDSSWASKFDTTITFNNQYSVNAHIELGDPNRPSKFSFANPNSDFTIAKFLDVFGLGNLNSLPVVGQILNITVMEASLQMIKENDGKVKITEGRVSLYAEAIDIGSLFKLSQVNVTIGFNLSQQGYVFGFSVRGFINEKVYLDVEYDYYTSILSGQVAISTSNTGNFAEVLMALNKNGIEIVNKNPVFHNISESPTISIAITMKHISGNFTLTDVVIALNKNIPLGPYIQFSGITFSYKPAINKAIFELMGTISLMLGEQNYDFVGKFSCNNARSEFTVSTDHALKIAKPLGMFGITLNDAHLQIIYNYPPEEPHFSSLIILANVSFYAKDKSPSEEEQPTPSIVLECSILFNNYSPTVVKVTLNLTVPLTIADFVGTVFGWDFDVNKYLNIGFVNGQVYFAKLEEGTKSITINSTTYKNGYHISADIEVFDELFTINADISSSEVEINGYANSPLDLGFAKFTGVDDSDPSKPDVSKSPELSFVTDSSSTSISLDVGFVLFDVPFGAVQLGFKLKPDESKVFFGQLTYDGNIGFIENPSVEFEWSKEDGFKVTNWPVVGTFEDAFDFFDALRNYKDKCGTLVDLAFKDGVQTQFNINVNLSKTKHPDKFLADIDITGTYDVLLLKEVKIASVPIPNISVGIPIEDDFTLGKLPKFILDLFAKNSVSIIQQIVNYPDRLAKILTICLLEKLTKEVIATLVCRGVKNLDPGDLDLNDLDKIILKEKLKSYAELGIGLVLAMAIKQEGKEVVMQGGKVVIKQGGKEAVKQGGKEAVKQGGKEGVKQGVKQGGKEVVKQGGKEVVKQGGKEVVKQGGKEVVKQGGKEVVKQGGKEVAKQGGKEVVKQGGKEVLKQGGKEVVKQGGKEVVKQGGKEMLKQGGKEVVKQGGKEVVKQGGKEVVKQGGKEVLKQGGKEVVKQGGKEVVKQGGKEMLKQGGKEVVKQGGKEVVKQGGKEVLKQGGKEMLKQGGKEVVKQGGKEVVKQGGKEVVKQGGKAVIRGATSVVGGLVIEGVFYGAEMSNAVYKRTTGQMDSEEFMDLTVKQTATSGGSAAGGLGGSLAGAAIGAAAGSFVPVIGTAIGAVAGGVVGGISGGLGGSLVGNKVGGMINSHRGKNTIWKLDCNTPNDIAIALNNELIILDSSCSKALVVSTELTVVKELSFSGNAAIANPSGIAVSGATIAVGDSSNHVVKILTFEAKYLSIIKFTTNSKGGQFDVLFRMQFNSKGVLYVLDYCNRRVQAFDTNKRNRFCGNVGSQGSDPGQYQQPNCVAVDGSDNVYVTDYRSKCINMYSGNDHVFLFKIDCDCKPCAIAFSPDNHLIVGDHENNCIRVFGLPQQKSFFKGLFGNNEKEHSRKPTNVFGAVGSEKGEFNEICGIVVNSHGTICVVESNNGRLQLIGTKMWRT